MGCTLNAPWQSFRRMESGRRYQLAQVRGGTADRMAHDLVVNVLLAHGADPNRAIAIN